MKKAMLVTGGTVGSSLVTAERFAKEGYDIYITSRSRERAQEAADMGVGTDPVKGTIKTQRWVEMGSKQIVNGSLTPIGDISDFEDIANAAWYLGSDESKNVIGTVIIVDGGMSCQLYPQLLNELKQKEMENL